MNTFSLSKEDQGVVVFHFWKSLPYKQRMFLSFFLIAVGLILQYNGTMYVGLMFILFGNLLSLVKGYDNRVKLGKYSAVGEWVKTDKEHLDQIVEMNKKLKKVNSSPFDITARGIALIIPLSIALIVLFILATENNNYYLKLIAIDTAVLYFPHWFTGLKRMTSTPLLLVKIAIYNKVLREFDDKLQNKKLSFMIYVKGQEDKLPSDVKMKIDFENQPEDFLGLYAQISLNNVEGKYYPYFYMVLVAKETMELSSKYFNLIQVSNTLIKEKSKENNMDIIVIRQHTTKTSGYHTKIKTINKIFEKGLNAAELIIN